MRGAVGWGEERTPTNDRCTAVLGFAQLTPTYGVRGNAKRFRHDAAQVGGSPFGHLMVPALRVGTHPMTLCVTSRRASHNSDQHGA